MKKVFNVLKNIWCKPPLFIKILIGLGLGILFGFTIPGAKGIGFIGDCFIYLLKAIAPILVFFIVSSSLGNSKKGIGSRFGLVIGLYLITTFVAALISVGTNFIFKLKITGLPQPTGVIGEVQSIDEVLKNLFVNAFTNPFKAIGEGNYIGILFWAVLLGIAFKIIKKQIVVDIFSDISDAITLVIHWIMELSPFGIMGLVFSAISENGADIFIEYGLVIALIVGIFLVLLLIVNPLFFFIVSHKNPYPVLFKCLRYSGFSAFFTRSSAANIPNNLRVCDMYDVPKEFSSISIPLGSVINMNGAAVAITSYTLIACFSSGTVVDLGSALLLSLVATLAACGTSGIANGALMLLPLSCSMFGLDSGISDALIGIGMTLGVIVDCFETMLNSCSDAYFTIAADIALKRIQKRKDEDLKQEENVAITNDEINKENPSEELDASENIKVDNNVEVLNNQNAVNESIKEEKVKDVNNEENKVVKKPSKSKTKKPVKK